MTVDCGGGVICGDGGVGAGGVNCFGILGAGKGVILVADGAVSGKGASGAGGDGSDSVVKATAELQSPWVVVLMALTFQ